MMHTIARCVELHRRRPVRVLRDPGGMVIAAFAWGIMLLSMGALWASVSKWLGIWSFWGVLEAAALTVSVAMCMWTHFMVMTTEPGFVPMRKVRGDDATKSRTGVPSNSAGNGADEGVESDSDEMEDFEMPLNEFENLEDDGSLLVFCDECNQYRPTRAMHCDTCERCVVLMDHHCPWVNNCVGIGNQKYFLLFLFYVTVSSIHAMVLILLQRWSCRGDVAVCGFEAGQFPGRLGIWLLAASCVFGLFCAVMLGMEIHSINDDPIYGNIATRLNARTGCKSSSRLERHLSVIFGTNGFEFTWLWPLPRRHNRQDWEIIGGFAPRTDGDDHC